MPFALGELFVCVLLDCWFCPFFAPVGGVFGGVVEGGFVPAGVFPAGVVPGGVVPKGALPAPAGLPVPGTGFDVLFLAGAFEEVFVFCRLFDASV
jgi:hypothetical protein